MISLIYEIIKFYHLSFGSDIILQRLSALMITEQHGVSHGQSVNLIMD